MYVSTVTISSKGQIVLPKRIRSALNTNTISLRIDDRNQVLLTPVNTLSGALASYSQNTNLSFEEIRKQSWNDYTSSKVNDQNKDKDTKEEDK